MLCAQCAYSNLWIVLIKNKSINSTKCGCLSIQHIRWFIPTAASFGITMALSFLHVQHCFVFLFFISIFIWHSSCCCWNGGVNYSLIFKGDKHWCGTSNHPPFPNTSISFQKWRKKDAVTCGLKINFTLRLTLCILFSSVHRLHKSKQFSLKCQMLWVNKFLLYNLGGHCLQLKTEATFLQKGSCKHLECCIKTCTCPALEKCCRKVHGNCVLERNEGICFRLDSERHC